MPFESWLLLVALVLLWFGGYLIGYGHGRRAALKNRRAPVFTAAAAAEAVRDFANPGRRP